MSLLLGIRMIMEKVDRVDLGEKQDPFIDSLIHTLISIREEAMERNWNSFKEVSE